MSEDINITSQQLLQWYTDYVLMQDHSPASVYKFAKEHNFNESDFYKHFGSFEALESEVFVVFFNNTVELLRNNEDYQNYDARHQLLSFYYTFFEILTTNRSYVMWALKKEQQPLKGLKSLGKLRKTYLTYVQNLDIEKLELGQDRLQKFQNKAMGETAWAQLLLTLKFWMEDESAGFEKTDIFIEKSINTSFDLINTQPLKSVMDLGKFLIKEKFQST